MPLAQCRECGRDVSTEAGSCPHCGVPRPTNPTPTTPLARGASPFGTSPTTRPLPNAGQARTPQPAARGAATAAAPQTRSIKLYLWVAAAMLVLVFIFALLGGSYGFAAIALLGFLVTLAVLGNRQSRKDLQREVYCTSCGTLGQPKKIIKGSFGVEVALWLLFLLPGLIYSVWRLTSKVECCSSCSQPSIIPSNSPRALQMRAQVKR